MEKARKVRKTVKMTETQMFIIHLKSANGNSFAICKSDICTVYFDIEKMIVKIFTHS